MNTISKYVQEQVDVIIDSIYNGVIAVDREGVITIFNPAAERILGIKAEEAIGEHIDQIIPDSGLFKVLQTKRCLLNQRQRVGEAIVNTNRTPVMEDDKLIGAVSVFQDITELEQIADELEHVKQLKSTLEEVIENPYEGIILVDKNGLVKMINDTYLQIVGRKREEVLGTHISLINENCNLPQVLKTGEPLLVDFCNVREQGLITMRVPIIRDGEMIGALGKTLFTDINVAKVLIEKLNQLERQLEFYKEECARLHRSNYFFEDIIGQSDMINSIKNIAWRVARSVSTVLITGESGTGKELFAHAIHNASERRKKPFIKVNCAAIPDNLLESELFGYVDGAFTGAKKGGKPGKFELANRGTIFLDEIGDMPLLMQAKLLRVLQEREVERIGSLESIVVDVRIIAATNQDLEQLVAEGKFREDLYYRLNIIQIDVPALRERLEDVPVLVDSLIAKLSAKLRKEIKGISPEALVILQEYHWPGNIRELENVLELAINMTEAEYLDYDDFPCVLKKIGDKRKLEGKSALAEIMALVEKQTIHDALKKTNGDKKMAAKLLAIHPSALYRKLNKYGFN
ncbi:MAG TPA: sigma 54-interacting transcriptional regulator [Syntrophomonadaceae bacterium]|nr:sigma 54-interacting transcriptional regulator [Syntrophomonadaceae bacterium]